MKGAILCGTKKYTSWMTENFIKENYSQIKNWTHLDINEKNSPDVVGSIFDIFTLYKMGIGKYDVVILDICFVRGDVMDEPTKEVQLLAASLLVRKGGHIVYVNMTRQYLTQLLIQNIKDIKYYQSLTNLYFSNDDENINKAMEIIKDIYNNLSKNIGIKFLKLDRKTRDIENTKFKYDYVIFQK